MKKSVMVLSAAFYLAQGAALATDPRKFRLDGIGLGVRLATVESAVECVWLVHIKDKPYRAEATCEKEGKGEVRKIEYAVYARPMDGIIYRVAKTVQRSRPVDVDVLAADLSSVHGEPSKQGRGAWRWEGDEAYIAVAIQDDPDKGQSVVYTVEDVAASKQ